MKKKGLIIVLVIVAIIALIVGLIAGTYNKLNTLNNQVEEKSAVIDTQLQRRSDLIPNLVTVVKQYAAHETEVYTAISDARSKLNSATTQSEKAEASSQLDSAVSRLLLIVENYPELKSNTNFIQLQDELAGTENRITVARNDYNAAVKEYNTKIKSFPTVLFAGMFGFSKADYFEASESASQAPVVSF